MFVEVDLLRYRPDMKLVITTSLFILSTALYAQYDTSIVIEELLVEDEMIRQSETGTVILQRRDTSVIDNIPISVSDWMESGNIGYVKTYGFGGLSTLSMRGLSAGHSLIVWNGLPVESPMLGQMDLSLLPLTLMNSVSLALGGQSGQWGSGAIGSVLHLDNSLSFGKPLHAQMNASFGQFDRYTQSALIGGGGDQWSLDTRIFHHTSVNDFSYEVGDRISGRQTNANVRMLGAVQSVGFRPTDRDEIGLHYWYQESQRHIPPTLRQRTNDAKQDDVSHRVALNYRHLGNRFMLTGNFGYFNEELIYEDPQIFLISHSQFHTYSVDVGLEYWIAPKLSLSTALTVNHTNAWISNYGGWVDQNRWSGFLKAEYIGEVFRVDLNVRQEVVDGEAQPVVPYLGLDIRCLPYLTLKAKVSRNFRYPTLNDLYWQPGGNRDLDPELGWSQELGLLFQKEKEGVEHTARLSAFHKEIHDWIYWAPVDGVAIWSANNLGRVRSWGVETRYGWSIRLNDLRLVTDLGMDIIRSRNLEALTTPSIEEGQRLFYVPDYRAFGTVGIEWNDLQISYRHQWTDDVLGINGEVDGFQIGSVQMGWEASFGKNVVGLSLNIENLWNEDYQIVEDRPMPGRYFELGVQLKMKK